MNRDQLIAIAEESAQLKRTFFAEQADLILSGARALSSALARGGKILAFGNGGSAADAQHFSAELVNRYRDDRVALAAIALTTDTSILTSVANDSDYREVFRRQVEALGREGDAALAISTSGFSPNVLAGVEAARSRGMRTVALSGRGGGRLSDLADVCIVVPHDDTQRIQEMHSLLVHVFCEAIEDEVVRKPEKERDVPATSLGSGKTNE